MKVIKKIRKFLSRVNNIWGKWYIQLIAILLVIILGLFGYSAYFSKKKGQYTFDTPIYSTIKLFTLSFDAGIPASDEDTGKEWYYVELFIAKWIALFITGTVIFKLLKPINAHFWADVNYLIWRMSNEKLLLVGNNSENRTIYQSAVKIPEINPLIECNSETEFTDLREKDYECIAFGFDRTIIGAVKHALASETERCTIVINTKDEEVNLAICKDIADYVGNYFADDIARHNAFENGDPRAIEIERKLIGKLGRLRVVVFGDKNHETTYQKMEKDSLGVLRYTNKYRMVAVDFISKYPMTSFIDSSKIDEYACIDKDYDLNTILVGFGDTNQELLVSSMIVNQFIQGSEGEIPRVKPVNYYIYDKEDVRTNKNLNHKVFRYGLEFMESINSGFLIKNDYLEFPDAPANISFDKTDVNDPRFYEQIWRTCVRTSASCNIIVIAIGSDLENIDLAQKILSKREEWELGHKIHIFVKVRNFRNAEVIDGQDIIPFGDESTVFLNIENIFNNRMEEMAIQKHYLNKLITSRTGDGNIENKKDIEIQSLYEWYMYDPMKKQSSIYSILSIKMKLQMMGLDYREKKDGTSTLPDNKSYFEIYARDSMPEVDGVLNDSIGKIQAYKYNHLVMAEDLKHYSLRQNLAVQEHYRWNAFMISCGFIPATIKQIKNDDKGTDYNLRRHGNLTTMEGLIEYRKLRTEIGRTELKNDVIKYDFRLMDEAWWFLDAFGFEVYSRKDQ